MIESVEEDVSDLLLSMYSSKLVYRKSVGGGPSSVTFLSSDRIVSVAEDMTLSVAL